MDAVLVGIYWPYLLGISAAFAVMERVFPARPSQPALRRQLANDLFYNLFNGHLYALLTGAWTTALALWARSALHLPQRGWMAGQALITQFLLYLLVSDFLQWCVHRLLHGVPCLWQFHKLHHSVHEMDWAANFRFHWMELVVYHSLLYLPLALLGGSTGPLFAAAVFGTAWGHFNHANLNLGLGPLGYLLNSPRMHLWHHDASDEGGVAKNFGIVFSLWDYLFRTVFWPRDRAPERIGYPDDEEMPGNLVRQLVFPLLRKKRSQT